MRKYFVVLVEPLAGWEHVVVEARGKEEAVELVECMGYEVEDVFEVM